MTFLSSSLGLEKNDLAAFGAQRARDAAFDAIRGLWARRRGEGLQLKELANRIDCNVGWLSRALRGPGNWTMRTLGELAAGLDGEITISVRAIEDAMVPPPNYDAWDDFDHEEIWSTGKKADVVVTLANA